MPELLAKISLTNFKPKAILAQPESVLELPLGTIVGIATGIKRGKMPDGVTPYEGMAGDFELKRPGMEPVRSGVCYLPDGFMQPILTLLKDDVDKDGNVTRDAVSSVQMAYNVSVIRADNPAGYSWKLTPLTQAQPNDPLAELRKLIPDNVATIEDKSGDTAQIEDKGGATKETAKK